MDLKLFWRALQQIKRSCFQDHLQVSYIILELSYNFLKCLEERGAELLRGKLMNSKLMKREYLEKRPLRVTIY